MAHLALQNSVEVFGKAIAGSDHDLDQLPAVQLCHVQVRELAKPDQASDRSGAAFLGGVDVMTVPHLRQV
jgi:hypothetical protein